MVISRFEEIESWRRARELGVEVYGLSTKGAFGKDFGLRAAVYEFSYEPIIAEFRDARKKCGDVQIIYDARIKKTKGRPDKQQSDRVAFTRSLLKKYGLAGRSIA